MSDTLRRMDRRARIRRYAGYAGGGGNSVLIAPSMIGAPLVLARSQISGVEANALGGDNTTWQPYGADQARFNGTERRLLIGGQRTNSIRNPRAEGAVAGTPGTLPTNASISLATGLSSELVGSGVQNGIAYVDVRIVGTPTSSSTGYRPEASYTAVPAANGQTWTASLFVAQVGGSLSGITTVAVNLSYSNSSSVLISGQTLSSAAISLTSTMQLASVTLAASDAAVAFARMQLLVGTTAGAAVDATLRIGWPQLEQGAFVSTPILPPAGAPAASTRGADLITAPLSSLGIPASGACTVLMTAMIPQNNPAGLPQSLIEIDDGTLNNRMVLRNVGGTAVAVNRANAGVAVADTSAGTMVAGTPFRVGVSIDGAGRIAASLNGSAAVAVTGGPTSGLTTLRLGNSAGGATPMSGETSVFQVLPFSLSDADLAARVAALPL